MRALAIVLVCAACARPPAPRAPGDHGLVTVIVSADAEWAAVRARFPGDRVQPSPYGEWFVHDDLAGGAVLFFHGGWGKIAAAGGTQYVIDRFEPSLIVNLGTCGGFGVGVTEGEVVLVDEAVVYDLDEKMGDADEASRFYTSKPDVALWPAALRSRVRVGHLASADRDVDPAELPRLRDHFHAIAGDWESGAIAWVAAHNHTKVLILRGVSDVIDAGGDATYGAPGEFARRARATMNGLLDLFVAALPNLR
jgi:adenosylhomocysteine nucleosidase